LVFCSGGMSRSPAIAAGALSLLTGKPAPECLRTVVSGAPADLSPGLWSQVEDLLAAGHREVGT
jgi:hypothetical protein